MSIGCPRGDFRGEVRAGDTDLVSEEITYTGHLKPQDQRKPQGEGAGAETRSMLTQQSGRERGEISKHGQTPRQEEVWSGLVAGQRRE